MFSSSFSSDKLRKEYDNIWHTKMNQLKQETNLIQDCLDSEIEELFMNYVNSKYFRYKQLLLGIRDIYERKMGFSKEEVDELMKYHCLQDHSEEIVHEIRNQILDKDYPILRDCNEISDSQYYLLQEEFEDEESEDDNYLNDNYLNDDYLNEDSLKE